MWKLYCYKHGQLNRKTPKPYVQGVHIAVAMPAEAIRCCSVYSSKRFRQNFSGCLWVLYQLLTWLSLLKRTQLSCDPKSDIEIQSVSPNPLRFRWTIHENFCANQNGYTYKPYIVDTLLTTRDVSNDMIVSVQLVAYAADSLKVKFQNHPTPNKQDHSHPQYLEIWRLMHAVWNQVGWELTLKMSHRVLRWLSCYAFLHIVFFSIIFFKRWSVVYFKIDTIDNIDDAFMVIPRKLSSIKCQHEGAVWM